MGMKFQATGFTSQWVTPLLNLRNDAIAVAQGKGHAFPDFP